MIFPNKFFENFARIFQISLNFWKIKNFLQILAKKLKVSEISRKFLEIPVKFGKYFDENSKN